MCLIINEEKHKFNKCWHCGRENIYYKVNDLIRIRQGINKGENCNDNNEEINQELYDKKYN